MLSQLLPLHRAYTDGLALAVKVFQTIGQTPMLLDVIPSDVEGTK